MERGTTGQSVLFFVFFANFWVPFALLSLILVSLDRTLDWITQIARVGLVLIRNSGLSISDGSQSEPSNKTADCYG